MSFKDINETVFQIKMVYFHEKKGKKSEEEEESRGVASSRKVVEWDTQNNFLILLAITRSS